MVTHLQLLEACQKTYDGATIVAGPDGRDGASLTPLPEGGCVLAFRGTVTEWEARPLLSWVDWCNDFHAELVKSPGMPGRVHAGFLSTLTNLWPLIEPQLPASGPVYVTGHSKGGAVAQLAAVYLRERNPAVVTFAAPRAGNVAFSLEYPAGCVRYEKVGDIVPMLPVPSFLWRAAGDLRSDLPASLSARELAVAKLIAEEKWDVIVQNHHLASYAPFVSGDLDKAA